MLATKIITIEADPHATGKVIFSRDGQMLTNAGLTQTSIYLWDSKTGEKLRTLEGHEGAISAVAFSPDGNFFASGGRDKRINIWNTSNWQIDRTLVGHSEAITDIAFNANCNILISSSLNEKTVNLWVLNSGKLIKTLDFGFIMPNPSTNALAVVRRGEVSLYEINTGELLDTIKDQDIAVSGLAYSSDGNLLASETEQETVKIWRVANHENILTLGDRGEGLRNPVFSPNGEVIATGNMYNAHIDFWNVRTGKRIISVQSEFDSLHSLTFSADGTLLACGSGGRTGGTIEIWKLY